jgi:outer membrane protein
MKRLCLILVLFLPLIVVGQVSFTLKSAIDTTLKNNFDIQIAANSFEISKINNTAGVAGAMPQVSASAGGNQSVTNGYQKQNTGEEITTNNISNSTLNSNINVGLLLFNGLRVVATRNRLDLLQKQSEFELNLQIQNSIAEVMAKYYDIVRQQNYLKIIQASLDVSQKKLEIVTERKKIGMANDADYLQALIDLNSAEQNLKTQELVVDQTKTELFQIINIKNYYSYTVEDSIVVDKTIQLNPILAYLQKNPQYLSSEQQVKINEQIVKEISALRYPSLRINTGMDFNRNQSDAGLTRINQNYGPYAGLTLQVPIYNGNAYKVQRKTAVYNVSNAKLEQQNLINILTADAVKTYLSYSTTLQQLSSQENSVELSGKLIKVVMQQFQLGEATILDVKAAQASFENTGYQLVNLKYAAKIAEIELKRLQYQLGE